MGNTEEDAVDAFESFNTYIGNSHVSCFNLVSGFLANAGKAVLRIAHVNTIDSGLVYAAIAIKENIYY